MFPSEHVKVLRLIMTTEDKVLGSFGLRLPLVRSARLRCVVDSLFPKHLARGHEQGARIAPQVPHAFRLNGRHAQQVFQIRHVGGELGQLRMKMRELARLLRRKRAQARCRAAWHLGTRRLGGHCCRG